MNTHRAYAGADNTITCWVRDESGNRDLSAETLTVPVYAYGHPCELLTLDAAQVATPGKVEFTVTESQGSYHWPLISFQAQQGGAHYYSSGATAVIYLDGREMARGYIVLE